MDNELMTGDETESPVVGAQEEPDQPPQPEAKAQKKLKELNRKIAKIVEGQAEKSKAYIDHLSPIWRTNIEFRIGGMPNQMTTYAVGGDVGTESFTSMESYIAPDWALTKAKIANLFSMSPEVRLTHRSVQFAPAIPPFAKALNDEAGENRADLSSAMEEVLSDVVNAAGIGGVEVGFAARFKTVRTPMVDSLPGPDGPIPSSQITDDQLDEYIAAYKDVGEELPIQEERVPTDSKFYISRFSPNSLIIPANFAGSNYNRAAFLGRDGICTWSEGKAEFKLSDEDKRNILAGSSVEKKNLNPDPETRESPEPAVHYKKIFYWRYMYDPDEPHFSCIWKIVFVEGLDEPAIHEPWRGQKYDEASHSYLGSRILPIQLLTVTYVTDMGIPPSDSEAGRPQVIDMRRSRTQLFENRERSKSARWFDDTRVDPEMRDILMHGDWQGMIPVKGDGSRIMGEMARASYPQENLEFDTITKADLMEVWQIGPNQMGTSGHADQTAAETEVVQNNFSTRIGQERGRVTRFIANIYEVLAGLMALYSDFPTLSPEERQVLTESWNIKQVAQELVFKIRPDSTVLVDTESRIKQILRYINYVGKSGMVDLKEPYAELTELHGFDPGKVMIPPAPHEDPPKISLAFSGADLQNPLNLAILYSGGKMPTPPMLEVAKAALAVNVKPIQPPPPPGGPPQLGPGGPPPMIGRPGPPQPSAHPDPNWGAMPKVMEHPSKEGAQ